MTKFMCRIVAGGAAAVAFCTAPAFADRNWNSISHFEIVGLGTLGGNMSYGRAINNAGQVTGESSSSIGTEAFLWDPTTGVMQGLGTLGGGASFGYSINDAGQVTGESSSSIGTEAFLWDPAIGNMQGLGTLGDGTSAGFAISNAGQVTGRSSSSGGARAFLWDPDTGEMQSLGTPLPTFSWIASYGYAINSIGQVAGYATGSFGPQAILWDPDTGDMQALGPHAGGIASYGYAINTAGQVTGASSSSIGTEAFLWDTATGNMQGLGTLGGNSSTGWDINDWGWVVGNSRDEYNQTRAFLYDGNQMWDLNDNIASDSGWTLTHAQGINASGQITGWGTFQGNTLAYVLTPVFDIPDGLVVPMPPAAGLVLLGMGALSLRRRRQSH